MPSWVNGKKEENANGGESQNSLLQQFVFFQILLPFSMWEIILCTKYLLFLPAAPSFWHPSLREDYTYSPC